MLALRDLLLTAIELYTWCIIISAILSWLIAFNVVNTHNRVVFMIVDFFHRITEPALRPLRRVIPNLGGIDISPVILILLLWFMQRLIFDNWPVPAAY